MPDRYWPDNFSPHLTLADTAAGGGRDLAIWLAFGLVGAGIIALGVIIAMLVLERAGRKRSPAAPTTTLDTDEAAQLLELMNRAEALADRLGKELDDRARRAQRVLDQLDRRLAAADLSTPTHTLPSPAPPLPQHRPPNPVQYPVSAPPLPPISDVDAKPADLRPPVVVRPVNHARTTAPVGTPPQAPHTHTAAPAIDAVTPEVYRLADAGLPPADIARRVGQSAGTVALILALRLR